MRTARPVGRTKSGSGVSSSAGPSTSTSWPSARRARARSTTWDCTPPGTSKEYGQTTPILIQRSPTRECWPWSWVALAGGSPHRSSGRPRPSAYPRRGRPTPSPDIPHASCRCFDKSPPALVREVGDPQRLHHVPVRRAGRDVGGERVGHPLGDRRDLLPLVHDHRGVHAQAPAVLG